MSLQKGGNTVVPATELRVALGWRKGPATPDADALAVQLGGRTIRTEADFVPAGPLAPDRPPGARPRYAGREHPGNGERELFSVDLAALPDDVDRVLFALRSAGAGFGSFAGLSIVVQDPADGHRVARYDCTTAAGETVLLLGEFYRRGEQWKFRALGQGYDTGLDGLAADIGLDAGRAAALAGAAHRHGAGHSAPAADPAARRAVPAARNGSSAVALRGGGRAGGALPAPDGGGGGRGPSGGAGGYLPWTPDRYLPSVGPSVGDVPDEPPQIIVLTPHVPGISLAKHGATRGTLRINLNWSMLRHQSQQPQNGFLQWLFGGEPRDPELDLDLCCLWELQDGRKGVIQPTGNRFGALHRPPYVRLDKDDRTGATEDGENLDINLDHSADFRRLLVFSVIYEGASGYGGMDAAATMYPPYGRPIEVRLDETGELTRMCAIALIENVGGELVVHREVRYIPGNEADVDRAYGWGLRWSRGYK